MPVDLSTLYNQPRLLIVGELRVAAGFNGRFQPTGFPDLGPALYKGVQRDKNGRPATIDMLLVDSAQSIANWLEEACVDADDYNDDCRGIPYVRVLDGHRNRAFLTSSVLEPHRLASPYVLHAKHDSSEYIEALRQALQADKTRPVHVWKIVPEIFQRDAGSVLHGVFLEEIDGRMRLPRLVSASIDAAEPQQVNSGGVYRGQVTAADNIPYPRQEFTSTDIKASFILHLGTLQGHRLGERERGSNGKLQPKNPALSTSQGDWTNEEAFLILWALYKIDRFLRGSLRLRTACEFELASISTTPQLTGWWPNFSDIQQAFTTVKRACFSEPTDGDEWKRRRVQVLTYAVDIVGESDPLPDALKDEEFKLTGFESRAQVKQVQKGRGQNKRMVRVFALSGDWQSEDDQEKLLEQNPETSGDDNQANPAHKFVQQALKEWNAKLKKQRGEKATDEKGQPS